MHINEGSGMITNPTTGLVEFIDEALPGTPGSTVLAEWGNAITFEIQAILEAAGLDLADSAADDRTAGWHQIKTALFDSQALNTTALTDLAVTTAKIASGAVNNDKVSNLDLDKLYGELILTGFGAAVTQMNLNDQDISFLLDSSGVISTAVLSAAGLLITGGDGEQTQYLNKGTISTGVGAEVNTRLSAFNLSTTGNWTTTTKWDGVLSGLKKTEKIFNAYVTIENTEIVGDVAGDGSSIYDGPEQYFGGRDSTTLFQSALFTSVDTDTLMQGTVYLANAYNTVGNQNIMLYVVHS